MSVSYAIVYGKFIKLESIQFQVKKEIHICGNKKCSNYNTKIKGNFCSECGDKPIDSKEQKNVNIISFLKEKAVKKMIDADSFDTEYYYKNLLFIEGLMESKSEEFKTIPINKINEIADRESEVFDFIIKTLDKNKISYKVIVGSYLSVA